MGDFWPESNRCLNCNGVVRRRLCGRCYDSEATRLAERVHREAAAVIASEGINIEALEFAQAIADREVALMMLSAARREVDRLRAEISVIQTQRLAPLSNAFKGGG
jgi:hypothetical protein